MNIVRQYVAIPAIYWLFFKGQAFSFYSVCNFITYYRNKKEREKGKREMQ